LDSALIFFLRSGLFFSYHLPFSRCISSVSFVGIQLHDSLSSQFNYTSD
jgi:hypothetical protein